MVEREDDIYVPQCIGFMFKDFNEKCLLCPVYDKCVKLTMLGLWKARLFARRDRVSDKEAVDLE